MSFTYAPGLVTLVCDECLQQLDSEPPGEKARLLLEDRLVEAGGLHNRVVHRCAACMREMEAGHGA